MLACSGGSQEALYGGSGPLPSLKFLDRLDARVTFTQFKPLWDNLSGCPSAGADCRQVRPAWCAGAPCRLFCLPGAAAKGSVGKAGQTGWVCGERNGSMEPARAADLPRWGL